MISKEQLITQAETFLIFEESAEQEYTGLINKLHDADVIDTISKIRDDEIRHAQICREIIATVKGDMK